MHDIVLGIDLGTTYSCAAYVLDGKPRVIPSEKGYATVPSVVGLSKKGEIVVGHTALEQMVAKPEETIYGSKRLIGRKYNSLIVQKVKETMTYSIVEGPGSDAAVMLGGTLYTLPQISAYILGEIRDVAQRQLEREITRAVITVPAYYSDSQRHAVKEAGALAGLKVEKIVNEPTAAALAYGFNRGIKERVLVYDLGGGTFDVSVLEIHGNEFHVLATGGDTFLGGVDFDIRISDYVMDKFQEASKKDIRPEKIATQRVRATCERAKRDLSVERTVKIQLPYITEIGGEPVDLALTLTRDQINKLTTELIDRTIAICDEVLKSANLAGAQIDEILLVGGQTRMPLVQEKVQGHFGKPPRKGVHPDEVVALGAALLGVDGTGGTHVQLKDVLSIPVGIALPSGNFKPILEKNLPIPASKSFKVTLPSGKKLEIDVYQGEKVSVIENEYLGTFQFPPIPNAPKEGTPLELRFDLTAEGLLNVRARDLKGGAESSLQMVTLQAPKSLKDGLEAAMQDKGSPKAGWFTSFARRVTGKS